MRWIATLAVVFALATLLSACGSSSYSLPSTPTEWRASIVAAALAQKSVHWTEYSFMGKAGWYRFRSDVTTVGGTQRLTTWKGGTAEFRLVGNTLYVLGNEAVLRWTLGLPTAQAKQYAGRWISIPEGDELYGREADGLTIASIIDDVTPFVGHSVASPFVGHSWKLKVVRERARETLVLKNTVGIGNGLEDRTLSTHATRDPLPFAFTSSDCLECYGKGSFSKWNEPVHVQAPAHSTPIQTVRN